MLVYDDYDSNFNMYLTTEAGYTLVERGGWLAEANGG